jgi:hypothetical protein
VSIPVRKVSLFVQDSLFRQPTAGTPSISTKNICRTRKFEWLFEWLSKKLSLIVQLSIEGIHVLSHPIV